MYWVRTRQDFGDDYLTNPDSRASRLLGIEWDFWLNYVAVMRRYNEEGKLLFRARRQDPDGWAITDTVFDTEDNYNAYFAEVDGSRIEAAMTSHGYQFIKEVTIVDEIETVINERPLDDTYFQLITPEYGYLIAGDSDI